MTFLDIPSSLVGKVTVCQYNWSKTKASGPICFDGPPLYLTMKETQLKDHTSRKYLAVICPPGK